MGFTDRDYIESSSPTTAAVYTIIYDHTFKQSLDMSETKDKIDWTLKIPNQATGYIKHINAGHYKERVQLHGKAYLNKDSSFGADADYSYSKTPWLYNMLDLFNNNSDYWGQFYDEKRVATKHCQTIRKELLDNSTDKKLSVVLPENLAFFGNRFDTNQPIPMYLSLIHI